MQMLALPDIYNARAMKPYASFAVSRERSAQCRGQGAREFPCSS